MRWRLWAWFWRVPLVNLALGCGLAAVNLSILSLWLLKVSKMGEPT